jgi:hypothetical protein
MSFNSEAKRVQNPQLPMSARRYALRSCFQRFTRLASESYRGVTARYEARFHCTGKHSTEEQLIEALSVLATERNLVLENLRAFERRRVEKKVSGRRTLSKAEQHEFREVTSMITGNTAGGDL